jgi:replicative DNA helicase
MNKKHAIEMIIGLIMFQKKNEQIATFNRIKTQWLKTPFQKHVHKAIDQLIQQNENIDQLTLLKQFRSNGWMDKSTTKQISALTIDVHSINVPVYLNSLFMQCVEEEVFERAVQIRNQIDNFIETQTLTFEKFHDIIESGRNIEVNDPKEKTNVDAIFDVLNDHESAKRNEMKGISIGYNQLKEMIVLEDVDLLVIGARPAMGKTAFAVSTVMNLIKEGKKVAFFALEMSTKQMMRRMIANVTSLDSNMLKFGRCTESQIKKVFQVQTEQFWSNLHLYEGTHTIKDIAVKVSDLQMKDQVDIVFIDYLQKIKPINGRSRYEQVTEISNGIKLLCQNLKVPCVALAQLSRSVTERGGDKRPVLSDLKESGEIEQDASIVSFLHRPEYYGQDETFNGQSSENKCEFIVAKNREGEIGIVEFDVNLSISKFW